MEIADVFVINKADRPGVAETRRDLEQMLDLSEAGRLAAADRAPPSRSRATAWTTLVDAVQRAPRAPRVAPASSTARRDERLRDELRAIVTQRLRRAGRQPARRPASATSSRPRWWRAASTRGPRPTRCWPGCPALSSSGDRVAGRCPATDQPLVTVERRDDGVAVVTLDHPKVNALSSELLRQLLGAATALTDDPPGAVVVTGGDRVFAAGADIAEFGGPDEARRDRRPVPAGA